MAVRISQRQIFSSMLGGMNSSLATLMDLHAQNSSQKKINRPSDDPFGASQILNSRATLSSISQYRDNMNMAKGWISSTDGALELVGEQLVELQTLMQQGANGTLTEAQRQDLSVKANAILDQIISLANTSFNGRYIFAGHKTDSAPYARGLGVACKDANMSDVIFQANGDASTSITVQFTGATAAGPGDTIDLTTYSGPLDYRYSNDGGATWTDATVTWPTANGDLDVGTAMLNVKYDPAAANAKVTLADPANKHENDNGTWLYIKPTAMYLGDTNTPNVVQTYPSGISGNVIGASGNFAKDVAVRINGITGGDVEYSYSTDNGSTWTSASVPNGTEVNLPIPGGVLSLNGPVAGGNAGDQYVVKPYCADVEVNIGQNASIVINNVGLEIFGGLFEPPFTEDGAQFSNGYGQDLFSLIGDAITAAENNSQQGCQEVLGQLDKVIEHVVRFRTQAGAKANRVTSIGNQLDFLEYDEEGRLSTVEDADISELLTKLSNQQLAYNSVLKSSSMIMQMSLMNFL